MRKEIKEFVKIEKKEDLPVYIIFPFLFGMVLVAFGCLIYEMFTRFTLEVIIVCLILGIGSFIGVWLLGMIGLFLFSLIIIRD